jgi:hypothetical protein
VSIDAFHAALWLAAAVAVIAGVAGWLSVPAKRA